MLKIILFVAITIAVSNALFEERPRVYCSLIEDKSECNKTPECMYTNIDLTHVYKAETDFNLCYDKTFVINSLKVSLRPESYTSMTDKELASEAGISEAVDLKNPTDISKVVNKLIENAKIKFIVKFEYLE